MEMPEGAQTASIDLENPEFQNLLTLINHTDNSVFLTGKAGTGKSTFLKYITSHTKKKHVVLAPTGIAAVNVGGMTLHSFFMLPFKPLTPDDPEFAGRRFKQRMRYSPEKKKLLRELELIVIDEISMVRADILDFIDRILRTYGGNPRLPFGGKQLLLVGDMFQLEPVVTADMRDILRKYYPNSLFFSAHVLREVQLVSIELRKVYRQNDSEFISLLDRIRLGRADNNDIALLNSRLTERTDNKADISSGSMTMTLAARRETVDDINASCLKSLDTPIIHYQGTVAGDFPESSRPTTLDLELKEGAQVVFIKNDNERRWVNGTIARVVKATPKLIEVDLEDGTRHAVEQVTWQNIKYTFDEETKKIVEEVVGEFIQYPLRLAWALTIHKSQGLTFNNVEIDMGHGAFSSGQTYVALSRCRSFEGLKLRATVAMRDIFVNPEIIAFSHTFNDPAAMRAALDRARADDCYRRAAMALDTGDAQRAFELFIEATKARSELSNPAAMRLVRRKLGIINRQADEIKELKAQVKKQKASLQRLATEYVSMGFDCLEDGYDPVPAIANFEKALSLDPTLRRAWEGKIRVLRAMGDEPSATKAEKQLKALGPAKRKKK